MAGIGSLHIKETHSAGVGAHGIPAARLHCALLQITILVPMEALCVPTTLQVLPLAICMIISRKAILLLCGIRWIWVCLGCRLRRDGMMERRIACMAEPTLSC